MSSKRIKRRVNRFGDQHPRGPQYPLEVPDLSEAHLRVEVPGPVGPVAVYDSRQSRLRSSPRAMAMAMAALFERGAASPNTSNGRTLYHGPSDLRDSFDLYAELTGTGPEKRSTDPYVTYGPIHRREENGLVTEGRMFTDYGPLAAASRRRARREELVQYALAARPERFRTCANSGHEPGKGAEVECDECGMRDCPWMDPMHYHHDGCPSCSDVGDEENEVE